MAGAESKTDQPGVGAASEIDPVETGAVIERPLADTFVTLAGIVTLIRPAQP